MRLQHIVSSVADGPMSESGGFTTEEVRKNRQVFLEKHGFSLEHAILTHVVFERENYCQYLEVTKKDMGDGVSRESSLIVDAIATREKEAQLLCPLADCIGVGIFDQRQEVLALSHLGRQSLEQFGGIQTVQWLESTFNSRPQDLEVYLSPAVGIENYPLYSFENRSLHDVACEQLVGAGVLRSCITVDPRDTYTDANLFSHSAFLHGDKPTDGRHALVCGISSD